MRDSIKILYNFNKSYAKEINIGPAFILLFFFVFIIILLAFYTKKTLLGRNWESNRCNYIFMSGFLQPNSKINASEYTLNNLKYCIRQTIYNETPLLGHVKDTFNKLKYLLEYIKHQIGIYENYIKINVNEQTQEYNDIMLNKVNYLKYKQSHIKKIYDELDSNFSQSITKVKTGIDNLSELESEKKINDTYVNDPRFINYVVS